MVTLKNGKVKTLGPDPHGEGRKHPPPDIIEKWHSLERKKPAAKDRTFAEIAGSYLDSLSDCKPRTVKNTAEHIRWFKSYVGRIKATGHGSILAGGSSSQGKGIRTSVRPSMSLAGKTKAASWGRLRQLKRRTDGRYCSFEIYGCSAVQTR